MEYLVLAIFIALSFFAIYRIRMFAAKGISKHWFALAFAAKLIAALVMVLLYSRSEEIKKNADIFRFYNDAQVIYKTLYSQPSTYFKLMFNNDLENPDLLEFNEQINNFDNPNSHLFNSNIFIVKYIAFLSVFTFGFYGAIAVITVFLAFTGLFWIFRFFNSKLKNLKWLIFAGVFFTPSVLFWSSGILKESLLIFSLGLLLNCGNLALKGRKPIMRLLMVLMALLLIFELKAFVFMVIIPPILAYLWVNYLPSQRKIIPYFVMLFIGFSFATESNKILEEGVFDILINKQLSITELAIRDNAQSRISPIMFQANPISVAANSPIAIINTLFRPMPWEANGITMLIASIENLAIVLLILLIIVFPRKNIENSNVLLFSLVFALSYFVIIGLATPVLGALSRYRVPGLVFFLMSVVQLIDFDKILKLIKKEKLQNNTNLISKRLI